MKIVAIILVFIILAFSNCSPKNNCSKINLDQLYNSWAYESEDDVTGVVSFLPKRQNMRRRRFTQTYEFLKNSSCNFSVLAPNDAHYVSEGSWFLDSKTCKLQVKNPDNIVVSEFIIVHLSEEKLQLRELQIKT